MDADSGSQNSAGTVPFGSAAWDRDAAERNRCGLTAHLDEVAETAAIQDAMARAVTLMRLGPGKRALDVGCGAGAFLPSLARAVAPDGRVVGLDHAAPLLEEARTRVDQAGLASVVELHTGDAHALPFPDSTFDAGHTERVLIHLAAPNRALRELKRVVKPGGWIVAVEPDLAGMRIDHADPESMRLLIAAFCATIRNPAMGLQLNRRMAEVGLVERQVAFVTEFAGDYPPDAAEAFLSAAEVAVGHGWLRRGQADAVLADLARVGAAGRYSRYATMFVVAGRVPD